MFPKEFINYSDKLYWVYKKIHSSKVKDGYSNDLKDFWRCDVVLKNSTDGVLLFLRSIDEVEVIK